VANPFCIKKCNFCIYDSTELNKNSDNFNYYYNIFLPNQIKLFKDVLEIRIPDTIYFGGGTPSIMSPEIMENIFNLIPNFRQIENKYIEIHPTHFSLLKLYKLIDYRFSYLSFGIQTVNDIILKEQSRQSFDTRKMQDYISIAKKNNITVSCDLLAFLHDDLDYDLEAFKDSFKYSIDTLQTDVICVYPFYKKIFSNPENEKEINQNYYFIHSLRELLLNIQCQQVKVFTKGRKDGKVTRGRDDKMGKKPVIHGGESLRQ
jgi:oxygen-independent coproporphyrinogen-3 oxidase